MSTVVLSGAADPLGRRVATALGRLASVDRVVTLDHGDLASPDLKSRIEGNEQIVHAAIVDALAESSRHNKNAACAALRRVQSIAPGTRRARDVSFAMSQAC